MALGCIPGGTQYSRIDTCAPPRKRKLVSSTSLPRAEGIRGAGGPVKRFSHRKKKKEAVRVCPRVSKQIIKACASLGENGIRLFQKRRRGGRKKKEKKEEKPMVRISTAHLHPQHQQCNAIWAGLRLPSLDFDQIHNTCLLTK